MQCKTIDDIKQDMSELYEQVRTGSIELKYAAELANIAGKFLKAEQLKLAREIFARAHISLSAAPNLPQIGRDGNGLDASGAS